MIRGFRDTWCTLGELPGCASAATAPWRHGIARSRCAGRSKCVARDSWCSCDGGAPASQRSSHCDPAHGMWRRPHVPPAGVHVVDDTVRSERALAELCRSQAPSEFRGSVCSDWLSVDRSRKRSTIQSPVRLMTHFAVHVAVEHAGGHAPRAIKFVTWNRWITGLIVAMAAPAIVDCESVCLTARDGKVVA